MSEDIIDIAAGLREIGLTATADYVRELEAACVDHERLVRELGVAINGEAGAAPQASLCDIVAQVTTHGLVSKAAVAAAVERRWKNSHSFGHFSMAAGTIADWIRNGFK